MTEAGATAVEQPSPSAHGSFRERIEPYLPLIAIVAIAFLIGLTSAARYHFPIAAGGLFLDAAQRISANDYRLPATLPHYTEGGVPFAYPPLMLYVLAMLHDISGISLLNLERVLPVLYTPVYLIPFYFLAKDFLKERNTALFATFIMAVSPSAFFYHFDAGGVVRSSGFAFLVFGLFATHRMFETGETRWVVASSISFALTLLTHVGYAAMFGASYVVFYAFLDRSWEGLLKAALAIGAAVVIASPWWIAVVNDHGIEPFRAALLTHRSAAGTVYRTATLTIDREPFLPIWHVLGSIGLLVLIARGRFFLPVWLGALILAYPPEESLMLVLSMTAAITVFEIVLPAVRSSQSEIWRGYGPAFVVAALSVYGIGSALALVQSVPRSDVDVWHPYIDQSDIDAMEWAKANTDADAQFMVVAPSGGVVPRLLGSHLGCGRVGRRMGAWRIQTAAADLQRHARLPEQAAGLPAGRALGQQSPSRLRIRPRDGRHDLASPLDRGNAIMADRVPSTTAS